MEFFRPLLFTVKIRGKHQSCGETFLELRNAQLRAVAPKHLNSPTLIVWITILYSEIRGAPSCAYLLCLVPSCAYSRLFALTVYILYNMNIYFNVVESTDPGLGMYS
jgi:hypothetical protein